MYEIKDDGTRLVDGRPLAFYDIECFPDVSMIVFKDQNKNIIFKAHTLWDIDRENSCFTHTDIAQMKELINTCHLVHFNGYNYDDIMLTSMIQGATVDVLKYRNDQIINRARHYYKASPDIKSYDVLQAVQSGLKKQEAFLGRSIVESSIPFDKEHLTEEEIAETYHYCEHDVDCTIDVYFKHEKGFFIPKQGLIDRFPEKLRAKFNRYNTTTISTAYLIGDPNNDYRMKRMTRWANIRLRRLEQGERPPSKHELENFEVFKLVPQEAMDFWIKETPKATMTVQELGLDIVIAAGGIHGTPTNGRKEFNDVIFLDVASLYPNIIRILNALGEFTDKFWSIVEERLQAKREGNKAKADALKLIINSVYGLLKNKHSNLYNPKASYSVCVFGQIALYDLSRRLYEAGCTLVNLNTDGIGFTTNPHDPDCYKRIWKEWEKDFDLVLEEDHFKRLTQKDVNNYLGIHKDGTMKAKGGDLKKYEGKYNPNNTSLGIVDLCVVNYIKDGTAPIRTIMNNLDRPILFQKVLYTQRKKEEEPDKGFIGTAQFEGDQRIFVNTVNRVFACKADHPERVLLKKVRNENDMVGVKFQDAPDNMIVYNDDLDSIENLSQMIDMNYYKNLAEKTIQRWV